MNTPDLWTPWIPAYDPRWLDGAVVTIDENGRFIESAECGQRCPGCGLCCNGYHDTITIDYAGIEEFEGNLKVGRGGLVQTERGLWYRTASCGTECPGYGRCCRQAEERERPSTVEDARRILFERGNSKRWELQEALLVLAHAGTIEAVDLLEAYMPLAHIRMEGFAQCALDEGRYFASCPSNPEERALLIKHEVWQTWEDRAIHAYGLVLEDLEPRLDRLRYEQEIVHRLLDKAHAEEEQAEWKTQAVVLKDLIGMTEADLEEQRAELALCEAVIAEIETDLFPEPCEEDVGEADSLCPR